MVLIGWWRRWAGEVVIRGFLVASPSLVQGERPRFDSVIQPVRTPNLKPSTLILSLSLFPNPHPS
jgi:hypothetical protein